MSELRMLGVKIWPETQNN